MDCALLASTKETLPHSAVRFRAPDDRIAAHEKIFVEVLCELACLGMPEEDRIAEREIVSPREWRLYFTGALVLEE